MPRPIIDEYAGTGAVYSFDPVGSYEREACRAAGAAQSLVQPFLDNQVSFKAVVFVRDANYLVALRISHQPLADYSSASSLNLAF